MGYFFCSLFLAYLKFGVFTNTLLGVLVFCELLFLYFSFLVGSLLYLNYYQIISVISLLVELLVPCQHLGTVLPINRFAGCSWNNTWLLQNRLPKLQESKWWPTFMPNLLTEVSHHNLQSSTIPACSWQGTCSRTGQPTSNCSTNNCAGLLPMLWWLTAEEALQVLKLLLSPAEALGLPPLALLWLQNDVILMLCLSDHFSNLQFRLGQHCQLLSD